MAKITAKAYIPSAREYDALKEKFPAFAAAVISKEKTQFITSIDVDWEYEGKGFFPLRTPASPPDPDNTVCRGGANALRSWFYPNRTDAGLRVGLSLIYDPESSTVKGCRMLKRVSMIWDAKKTSGKSKVSSTAPVVSYGGNDYIWTNKEDCILGRSKVMSLITLDIVDKAVPFDREGNHNDYAKAEKLREQCEWVAFEDATQEEKAMVVEVEMSSEDNYESLKYNLEKEDEKVENSEIKHVKANIDTLFAKLTKEEIQVKQWEEEANNIIDQMAEDEEHFSDDDIIEIGEYISTKYEQYKKRMSAKGKSKNISNIANDMGEEDIENE